MKAGSAQLSLPGLLLTGALIVLAVPSVAQNTTSSTHAPDLTGVYEAAPLSAALPGGLKANGTLADIALQPAAIATAKARDLKDDPAKNCQVIGPFRMMARDDNRIELVTSDDRITVLFENNALGNMRQIYLSRKHPGKTELSWMGDSVGSWDGDTLVVDSIGFNDRTWLNDAGAPHSDKLHLVERYRLLPGGNIIDY